MAWPNTPKAKDLIGMEPEELKTKLDSAATKDDLKAVSDSQEAIKGTLAQLQDTLKTLTTPKPADPPLTDDTDPAVRVLTDPKGMIADETKGLREGQLATTAQVQEMRARQDPQYTNLFSRYGKELTEAAKKYPIATRAQDAFWSFLIRDFLGGKMVQGEIRDGNFPSLLGSSSVGPRADGTIADEFHGLNPEMARWLKERGVSPEKAAKIKTLMVDQGEPITHANYFGKAN